MIRRGPKSEKEVEGRVAVVGEEERKVEVRTKFDRSQEVQKKGKSVT